MRRCTRRRKRRNVVLSLGLGPPSLTSNSPSSMISCLRARKSSTSGEGVYPTNVPTRNASSFWRCFGSWWNASNTSVTSLGHHRKRRKKRATRAIFRGREGVAGGGAWSAKEHKQSNGAIATEFITLILGKPQRGRIRKRAHCQKLKRGLVRRSASSQAGFGKSQKPTNRRAHILWSCLERDH